MSSYTVELKPLIRLPKNAIRRLIGKQIDYVTRIERTYMLDEQSCTNIRKCPVAAQYQELRNTIALEKSKQVPDFSIIKDASDKMQAIAEQCHHSGCQYATYKDKYHNDKKNYNLYQVQYSDCRFPKSAVKSYLFLASLPMELLKNDLHFIRNLSLDVISDTLNICKETALKSLEILASFGFITLSHGNGYDRFNIILNDFDTMHLTAREGGTGYLTLTSSMMETIISIKNVNALRLELLYTLKADDDSLRKKEHSSYIIKELKNILPSHMAYSNRIVYYKQDAPSVFLSSIDKKTVSFSLKAEHSLRIDQDQYIISYFDTMKEHLISLDIKADVELVTNLCELTREFTLKNILQALRAIADDYKEDMYRIRNFGALVRTYCLSSYISICA